MPGLKLVRGRILNTVYFRHGASERASRLPNIIESSFFSCKTEHPVTDADILGDFKRLGTVVVLSSPILGWPLKSRMPCR